MSSNELPPIKIGDTVDVYINGAWEIKWGKVEKVDIKGPTIRKFWYGPGEAYTYLFLPTHVRLTENNN
jgi:hypothetical protein